jgi:hypothetical protein
MTKKSMRSAIDAGFRWTAAHRQVRDVVEREGHWDRRPPAIAAFFALAVIILLPRRR